MMIIISNNLFKILDKIGDDIAMAILNLDQNGNIKNPLNISRLDISQKDWMFSASINGKTGFAKIGTIIREFFPGEFREDDILNFTKKYNKEKNEQFWGSTNAKNNEHTAITPPNKKADYKNIRETFLSLVTETYPHGHEEEVMHLMPDDLTQDIHGNYYKIIGNSTTLFTSHLDTASYKKSKVNLFTYKDGNDDIICTDQETILGADDKAGVAILLYMISHNIPGIYYFFMGEERGCLGSSAVVAELESHEYLANVNKVVAFDRRNYYSVITEQMGGVCCSDEFGKALCSELNKGGLKMNLDPTGILTDSACFMDDMPEITNISVGYFNEHTGREIQNITFLEKLGKAVLNVNWESLPIKRKVGISPEMLKQFKSVVNDAKKYAYESENPIKVMGDGSNIIIRLEVAELSFDQLYKDITRINGILNMNNTDSDITFSDNKIKIKLNHAK